MRVLFAVVFLTLPLVAAAQSSQRGTSGTPTLPSIGLPLPAIGLPLAEIGLPPEEKPKVDKPSDRSKGRGDRKAPPSRRPPRGDDRRGGHGQARTVYVVPAYPPWNYPAPQPPAPMPSPAPIAEPEPAPAPEPVQPTGTLALDVEPPGSAQVYVDDFYVGTIDELGRELTLEAGPHNVQLRAAGYETLNVNVKIDEGRTMTYRGALRPTGGKETPPAPDRVAEVAAAKKKPIYAIPGCYLGNVPPKEAALPPNCDPGKAITIKP